MVVKNAVVGMAENVSVPSLTSPGTFERQAARPLGLPAVCSDGAPGRQAELEARANLLLTLGAGPERIVARLLPRSADIVVA